MSFPGQQNVETATAEAGGRRDARVEPRPVCLIHIGYHRTGTSFLQTELFPLIPASAMTQYLDEAERIAADPTLRLAIMTAEDLSSDLERDRPELAHELAQKIPGARILIGIRSQYAIMRGFYHLHVKGGATEDYKTFVQARCGRLFNYMRMVDAYRTSFGNENVMVLPHEDLLRDPLRTMAALLKFVGADPGLAAKVINRRVKPSAGDATMRILRVRNRMIAPLRELLPKAHSQIVYRGLPGARIIDRLLGKRLRLPMDDVRSMIHAAYAEGNARLFTSLGLNGADYDYPLPGKS